MSSEVWWVVLLGCVDLERALFFSAVPRSLWDLSSPIRDQTQALAVKVRSPNHWTAREVPGEFPLRSVE